MAQSRTERANPVQRKAGGKGSQQALVEMWRGFQWEGVEERGETENGRQRAEEAGGGGRGMRGIDNKAEPEM